MTPQGLGESRLDGARVSQDAGGGLVVAARCAIGGSTLPQPDVRLDTPGPLAAGARADDASDDDGGDSDEDSLPDPDLVVASEDDE